MCQILVFNAIYTIDTDIECNIRIDRMPLVRTTTLGKSVYPDIALHISNYYIIIVFAPFLIILIIILPLLSFFRQKFVRHISRRCLDQTLWNLVGISYAMWSCSFTCWFFQNGCRFHGNGKNAKKLKKHKNDHSRLLAKQKLMKLDRNNIHI
jgi:hypothetical protein